jgi:sarcosine oxidase
MPDSFDVIVIGCGGFGSAACAHLADRNCRVLGLEQFDLVHDRGSSHGETRITRQAYFEHPDYVPLLKTAQRLWAELEQRCGVELFRQTGLILAGPADGEAVPGTRLAAMVHHLPLDELSPAEAARRFPGFRFRDDHRVLFEAAAGMLWVESCVRAHLDWARQRGAVLHSHETVRHWRPVGSGVEVQTDRATYSAGRLVITAGAWSAGMLPFLQTQLVVSRKVTGWFRTQPGSYSVAQGSPVFFIEHSPTAAFYGFPSVDGATIKLAEHSGRDVVTDPSHLDRQVAPHDLERLQALIGESFPMATGAVERTSVCMYTHSPDSHFFIDHHPLHPQVIYGAGFSGHGFKFTGVLGAALADLVLTGTSALPIDFLRFSRLSRSGSQPSTATGQRRQRGHGT